MPEILIWIFFSLFLFCALFSSTWDSSRSLTQPNQTNQSTTITLVRPPWGADPHRKSLEDLVLGFMQSRVRNRLIFWVNSTSSPGEGNWFLVIFYLNWSFHQKSYSIWFIGEECVCRLNGKALAPFSNPCNLTICALKKDIAAWWNGWLTLERRLSTIFSVMGARDIKFACFRFSFHFFCFVDNFHFVSFGGCGSALKKVFCLFVK